MQGIRQTIFSADRQYRYTLWREWDMFEPRYAMFTLLNPSRADEWEDDPSVRRCIGFTKAWGFGAVCLTNAFGYQATDPAELRRQADPVGPDNDDWLTECAKGASLHIVGWGVHGRLLGRDHAVANLLEGYDLMCLGMTKDGSPRHPLYLSGRVVPTRWLLRER